MQEKVPVPTLIQLPLLTSHTLASKEAVSISNTETLTTAPSITFTAVQPKAPPKEYEPRVPNFHTRGTVIQSMAILQERVYNPDTSTSAKGHLCSNHDSIPT
jgi:hypothetical protein